VRTVGRFVDERQEDRTLWIPTPWTREANKPREGRNARYRFTCDAFSGESYRPAE